MFRSRWGPGDRSPILLEARYYYQYVAGDGRLVRMSEGDRFVLLRRSNQDWWQVRHQDGPKGEKPFFVPASYVVEVPQVPASAKRASLPGRLWVGRVEPTGKSNDELYRRARTLGARPASDGDRSRGPRSHLLPPNPYELSVGSVSARVHSWPPRNQDEPRDKSATPPPETPSAWTSNGNSPTSFRRHMEHGQDNTSHGFQQVTNIQRPSSTESLQLTLPRPLHVAQATDKLERVNRLTKSMIIPDFPVPKAMYQRSHSKDDFNRDNGSPPTSPMLEKAGPLKKTKIAEGGRKLKKNWISSWVVLAGNSLAFYKEIKTQASSKGDRPESSVDLRGSLIEWTKEMSSKKNVFRLRTVTGNEYLLQAENEDYISDWYKTIKRVIETLDRENPLDSPIVYSLRRTASAELLECSGDEEESPTQDRPKESRRISLRRMGSDSSERKRVKNRIRKFIMKRPPLQTLQEKGLIKDQVFGCRLDALCEREKATVPKFVQLCINAVEQRGLDADGVYRVSGNLAVIQKLRFIVDHERAVTSDGRYLFPEERCQEEKLNMDDPEWEDIHVITGALKMFLRELPEPLFPFNTYEEFVTCIKIQDPDERLTTIKQLVWSLPEPNRDTMRTLFRHFQKVVEHTQWNRMTAQSLSIVFGPTLLRSEREALGLPFLMVYHNQIVELVLLECDAIFGEEDKSP
ncbi:rho GTPase-activating protein 15 isoform X3 [Hypanus sabinus]|uniref:rho GTPase-activating protein 15 isoform X3 n=1 Tax=Hypanus sabinus TaxID=79690 RepID=UPI0028C3CB6E|nr:rho GTPase-activating protein 15 isoform X3 [Hypanus sabinus]